MTRIGEYIDNIVKPGKAFSKHQIRMIEAIAEHMEQPEHDRSEGVLAALAVAIRMDMVMEERHKASVAHLVTRMKERAGAA